MPYKYQGLNQKQISFCNHYVQSLNITEAALKAGYAKKAAATIGCRLLKKVDVQKLISELQEKIAKAAEVSTADVLRNARYMFEYSIAKDEEGKVRNLAMAIKANDQLARLTGSYQDKVAVDATVKQIKIIREDIGSDD